MKDKILKFITIVAWIVLIISMMSMDSQNITIPVICAIISISWILLIAIANSKDLNDGGWRE